MTFSDVFLPVPFLASPFDLHPTDVGWRKGQIRKKKGLPLPLGRGVCETKSKNGRSRPRKPFISRGFVLPLESCEAIFRNNLARPKITSKNKITSRGYFYACFKEHFRRVLKNNLGKIK